MPAHIKFPTIALLLWLFAPFAIAKTNHYPMETWENHVLKLQHQIDQDAPLNQTVFLATHNSYNSKAYQKAFRYPDPNQILSIYDQLQAGIRSIELDVHWAWNTKFKKDLLLCHGQKNHLGCGVYDRHVTEALREIRQWLYENPDEVLLLYIEQFLDGHGNLLASALEEHLGNFIYKPDTSTLSCKALPISVTKRAVLRQGKQVIIVTKHCPDQHTLLNTYAFAGIGEKSNPQNVFIDGTITNFRRYPDCSRTNIFSEDAAHQGMWRIYEDQTKITKVVHPERKMTIEDLPELGKCNINWIAQDMLQSEDVRLKAAIWSWQKGYPQDEATQQCTIYETLQGIKNVDCTSSQQAYLCRSQRNNVLKLIHHRGKWEKGAEACQMLSPEWRFSLPMNFYEMEKMKSLSLKENFKTVWLNYRYKHGHFEPHAL